MTGVGYQNYLDIASARDVPTFKKRLGEFAQRLDFPLFGAMLVVDQPGAPPSVVGLDNAPDEFAETVHNAQVGARDPVLQRLKATSAPFVYDQGLYVNHSAGEMWEEQAPFGFKTGIALAMHMSGGRHFVLGVDRPDPLPADNNAVFRMMADLQLFAAYAQETAVRLLMPQAPTGATVPALSAREVEVLKWTFAGKSNQVIGQLLSISLSTVNFHLRTAMTKLGVASKHQAAAKANSLGLL